MHSHSPLERLGPNPLNVCTSLRYEDPTIKVFPIAKHRFPRGAALRLELRLSTPPTSSTTTTTTLQNPSFFSFRFHHCPLSFLLHPSSFVLTNMHLSLVPVFIDTLTKAAVVLPPLPQRRQALRPWTFGFVPATKGTKKQLGKGRNCQQRTMSVAPRRGASQRQRSFIFFRSTIGDFENPVGRHGEGREWGNTATATRSVTQHPSGGVGTFLGDPCTQASLPLKRKV